MLIDLNVRLMSIKIRVIYEYDKLNCFSFYDFNFYKKQKIIIEYKPVEH